MEQQQQQPPSPGQIRCSQALGCRQHRERVLALDFEQLPLIPVPRSPELLLHLSFPSASIPVLQFIHPAILEGSAGFIRIGSSSQMERCAAAGLCSTHCSPMQPLQQHQSTRGKEHLYGQCEHRISLLRANFWKKASPSLSPTRGGDQVLTALLKATLKAFLCSGRKQTPD